MPTVYFDETREGWVDSTIAHPAARVSGRLIVAVDAGDPENPDDDCLVLTLNTWCENHALTDDVQGKVMATLEFEDGSKERIEATCDKNPGRGWPWNGPTGRGGNAERRVGRRGGTVKAVRWEFENVVLHFKLPPFVIGVFFVIPL